MTSLNQSPNTPGASSATPPTGQSIKGDSIEPATRNNIFISFEPTSGKRYASNEARRRDVRSAAAKASAASRKATIAKKKSLAPNEDGTAGSSQTPNDLPTSQKSSKRRMPSLQREASRNALIMRPATPQLLRDTAMATQAFETLLWPAMMLNSDLHSVAMLIVATNTNWNALPGRVSPSRPGTLFLRGSALRGMYATPPESLARCGSGKNGSFAAAVAGIAAWEMLHGEVAAHNIHMSAWRTIFGASIARGTDERSHIMHMLQSVRLLSYNRVREISTSIATDGSTLSRSLDTMRTSPQDADPVSDYGRFNLRRKETRTLLFLLGRVANFLPVALNAWPAMHELSLMLLAWTPRQELPPEIPIPPCAFQDPDELEDLALYHVRAAAISISGAWSIFVAMALDEPGYFRTGEAMNLHYKEASLLATEKLLGTAYEEVALWAVFILAVTATPKTWHHRSITLLKTLMHSLDITTFQELESLLSKYAYKEMLYREPARALYDTVTSNNSPVDEVPLHRGILTTVQSSLSTTHNTKDAPTRTLSRWQWTTRIE